jgi:carbon-monoxide dehydrogenase medium subunit
VIPAAFDYERAESVDHALALLGEHGDEAKLLAGGHSLVPLMKFRLAVPAVVIDLGRVSELSYVRDAGDHLAIGALTRHRDVETDPLVASQCGLLAATTAHVGDVQVRHRGTIGGSIAHGDPASDLPAALLASGASMVVRGADGERVVPADEFFTGFLETTIGDTELLTEIRVPKTPDAGYSFQKFTRRAQDWAVVGVAALVDRGRCGVGLVNMGSTPRRAAAVEGAFVTHDDPADAAVHAADGCEPPGDLHATPEYREHLARVLTHRALAEATAPTGGRP